MPDSFQPSATNTRNSQRRGLYYRNMFITWTYALALAIAAFMSPNNLSTLLWLLPTGLFFYLLWSTYRSVHPPRWFPNLGLTPLDASLQYENVSIQSRDGLQLSGWFVSRPNRAAIILVHGLGGSSSHMIFHAAALAKGGYSVLMLNLRAHGKSQGITSTYGIEEANDVLGAVDYLRSRPDIDPERIGALGISLGAQAVVRAAAQPSMLRAVVAEGIGPSSLEDHGGRPTTLRRWINYPVNWLMYTLSNFMSDLQPEQITSTSKVLHHLTCPIMLISTGKGYEQYFNQRFYQAACSPKTLWEIPKARHAGGYFKDPAIYQTKIVHFFDQYMLSSQQSGFKAELLPETQ